MSSDVLKIYDVDGRFWAAYEQDGQIYSRDIEDMLGGASTPELMSYALGYFLKLKEGFKKTNDWPSGTFKYDFTAEKFKKYTGLDLFDDDNA